jgi:hypothetical protein
MRMGTAGGILLGAAIGTLFTSFGNVDTSLGQIAFGGGNEWTPLVTGIGTVIGATVGATPFFRHHIFSFLLSGLGLIMAIAIRDRYLLQPPLVFLNIFGIPLLGALLGVFFDRWRSRDKTPAVVALVGLTFVAVIGATSFAMARSNPQLTECKTLGNVTRCELQL